MAKHKDQTLAELAEFARLVVRSGYVNRPHVLMEVGNFVRSEFGDNSEAEQLADRLVSQAEAELDRDHREWPERTDNDALAEALAEIASRGFLTVEYCRDHFDASNALKGQPDAAGIVFFTETDVWHAITDHMLELKVWHADTSNVVAADPELAMVLDILERHGLPALFDEGRIEVSMTWQRRPLG